MNLDNKNVSLVLFAQGDNHLVDKMMVFLQTSFKSHFKALNIHALSGSAIDRAADNTALLAKASPLSFRTNVNGFKLLFGFFSPIDVLDIEDRMYTSFRRFIDESYIKRSEQKYPYSKNALKKLLKDRFFADSPHYNGMKQTSDILIQINSTSVSDCEKCIRLQYSIRADNISDKLGYLTQWMIDQIRQLDERFAACFCAAHISCNFPYMPIVHEFVYHIHPSLAAKNRLMGAEWLFYTSAHLAHTIARSLGNTMDSTVLKNGTIFSSQCSLKEYSDEDQLTVTRLLSPYLADGMSTLSFYRLARDADYAIHYPPQRVDVYDGGFTEPDEDGFCTCNPDIYLSYNYNEERLMETRSPLSPEKTGFMYCFDETLTDI